MESIKVIYLHIPKTAGMTFISILKKYYPENRRYMISAGNSMPANFQYEVAEKCVHNLDWKVVNMVNLIYGHMPFVNDSDKIKEFKYITILRDPINRVISDYNYVKATPANPLFFIIQDLSLKEYISRNTDLHLDNLQTRLLTGKINGKLDKNDYEKAIYNIDEKFLSIGITEYFDLSVLLFRNKLNWVNYPIYISQNVAKSNRKNIDQSDIELITKMNLIDIKLYDYAKQKFLKLIEAENEFYKGELEKFKIKINGEELVNSKSSLNVIKKIFRIK